MNEPWPLVPRNTPADGETVGDAIRKMITKIREDKPEAGLSIATAYINPAGFAVLADELKSGSRVRLLIGAEPEFEAEQALSAKSAQASRKIDEALESHEAWLEAERDVSGFTREAVQAAKDMVAWLEGTGTGVPVVEVRKYPHGFLHGKTFMIEAGLMSAAISGSSNFTKAGLTTNAELNLATSGAHGHISGINDWFEHYWLESEEYDLASLYKSQWEEHKPWTIFIRMLNELYGAGVKEDEAPVGMLGLTNFQRDGVARMHRLLAENGGVLVADEVGLGKSYLAGEVIKTVTEVNRQKAVIVCPAAIKASMWDPFLLKHDFKRNVVVYSYEQIRNRLAEPNEPGDDATAAEQNAYKEKKREWNKFQDEINDYSLIVIDEAHNLRNSRTGRAEALDRMILSGKYPKQVVLLTATPVNNSLSDLETLIKYFVRDDGRFANVGIPSIREYIQRAQDTDPENLTPEHLFDLMDQVAVRRTRKFVRDNYSTDKIVGQNGEEQTIKFPTARSHRIAYQLDDAGEALVDAMLEALQDPAEHTTGREDKYLSLARYTPSKYKLDKVEQASQRGNVGLLRSALLKRLESSPAALQNTLSKLLNAHKTFLRACDEGWVIVGSALSELTNADDDEFLEILEDFDKDDRKDIESIDLYKKDDLVAAVSRDKSLLEELISLAKAANQDLTPKFEEFLKLLESIAGLSEKADAMGIPEGDRRKVLVFSTFADTIIDLHTKLEAALASGDYPKLNAYKTRVAPPILGTYASTFQAGQVGGVDQGGRAATIAGFAPKTAGEYREGVPVDEDVYDILLTTDVLAEGVNLQQAGRIINFDLPWNPMRIVQRHGRVDRIGSIHDFVDLDLFFPAEKLDEMLRLEATLQRKLAQAHAAVGEHIEVLASNRKQTEVILHDKSMKKMDDFLNSRGGANAISGEEFRRKLYKHLLGAGENPQVLRLPYGAGSGFLNSKIGVSGYVFCAKVAKQEKPWFRFVQVDDSWQVARTEEGQPRLTDESLTCLIAADPGSSDEARSLSEEAYSGAFDAWAFAQEDILAKWNHLADPKNLGGKAPTSFVNAATLVMDEGEFLGSGVQMATALRLKAVPATRIERQVGKILRSDLSSQSKILEIIQVLDENGIKAPPRPVVLPHVTSDEIQLVAWMAVTGNAAKD
jgi:hypothetical protein